jgi:MerR family copper efflux transcriptional regulator
MQTLTIGQVAKASGVGVETIRFYEREGLIAEPSRRASGYRQYSFEAVRRVRFVRRAKELGFTLREIGELLSLREQSSKPRGEVRALADAKITSINERIRDLERIRRVLETLSQACCGPGTTECPILDALETDDTES